MDMHSRNQYLKALIEKRGYHLLSKKEKIKILNEYCATTGQNRNYVIRKIRSSTYLKEGFGTRTRKVKYDGYVKRTLVEIWRIFDHPCGQRLKPLIQTELERLRKLKEIRCSEMVASKLRQIGTATIDRKLSHQKEVERIRKKYQKKVHPLLYQKIPVKLSDEWNRSQLGNIQTDLIEHCGQSARGEYINTVSNTDIATGWWEGEAIMGRGQIPTQQGIDKVRKRFPFDWREIHSDNGTEYINAHLFGYTQKEKLGFSRSRPNKKNDNCFVEQKNWTHVKKYVGYLRYDTLKEQEILNNLYRHELRLYKNFFQPVIKLVSKERIDGKIHRKYEKAKTPYQRVMESQEVLEKKKQELRRIYQSLNPAELKRTIDKKLDLLYRAYQAKQGSEKVEPRKKLKPISLTFYIRQPKSIQLPS
ncbi:integrase [Candidatus Kuenenbacteria bacterium CG22_combo_CG10-13_8_21_14_all_39_9]|uniref:Integrase n=1 Tax=Candidatus Kuenenbacteria bacterium CG22_combo_CG10-13_8_21_14_all_39_9 TaxID=1974621 RepID=A0A2H0D0N7_9BACT|nr:MAG: integrase [Candidatus Kuenenbacteria bacterium CG22_combo_CG10-13_8_21_14_all_39_9]